MKNRRHRHPQWVRNTLTVLCFSLGLFGGLWLVIPGQRSADEWGCPYPNDYSGAVLELTPQVRKACFGFEVKGCSEKAVTDIGYEFQYLDGRATLSFDAGWIDAPQEVEIVLNGDTTVGYLPVTPGAWDSGIEMILPYDRLRQNAANTIVFDNLVNRSDGKKSSWAVRNVWVKEEPLPEPDPGVASCAADTAIHLWEHRGDAPGNLAGACRCFEDARNYLEKMNPRPPLYDEATARARECEKILAQKFKALRGDLKQAEGAWDWDKVRRLLELCLKVFPDTEDSRHQFCAEWLERFR